ncbi:ABC transporter substrate-binding protein [Lutimaribacter sp. EGI FJ00015]|uniref:ABC transporter substrate-binding protein n=1 Tax=Lutimaribacter degradans TaxID=2945989 RepID=A0ACC5ZSB6_9RHOB|nr:ABC transporter substrate-binding protein [Lutimaribacter sp. EGI FJ00013]MCM2561073.1 ABC transporter substrate-binding protein [Lutimaribacter sp. EGI FJ00013]MCO0611978.1 ABC transporter substrate-binding protein [Lutimaribacter sp. EGI FJ00015]MCO0634901.1 ABC transporter substrate-binding protein [Lutimaribacter sp. EGI FJ00014]
MKKFLTATAAAALMASGAAAEDVKIGILQGFTGPTESLVGPMASAMEMAIEEVNASGNFMDGMTVVPVRGDSTCIDASAGVAAAERAITSDGVKGIVGGTCSGVTGAILANVAVPNGIVMISPSATSPALTTAEDNGLFFRTAPSDARQGEVMADLLIEDGVTSVAVTYTNNDYGKGLADAFASAFAEKGGEVTIQAAHEDGKADYSAEVAALASAGGEVLVVAGYLDQGGAGVIRSALDSGAFDTFHLPDGMVGESLSNAFGTEIEGSKGQAPGSNSEGTKIFQELGAGQFDSASPYTAEGYDAAALIMLAMQAAGSTDPNVYKDKVEMVANAPGEKINPGELGRALQILADGGDVDLVGATGVELIGPGEAAGSFRVVEIKDGKFETVGYR